MTLFSAMRTLGQEGARVMQKKKKHKLEKAGWKIGDAQEFLDLSDAEIAIINLRVLLAKELKKHRLQGKVSQERFAQAIGSSQSRVAKMEAGDPSVTIDLLMRSMLKVGFTPRHIGKVIQAAVAA